MPLITCPECGKEISDKSTACIHCGCPLVNNNTFYSISLSSNNVVVYGKTYDFTNVYNLIKKMQKIDAIKECRELTGLSLKEAKDLVDSMTSPKSMPKLLIT